MLGNVIIVGDMNVMFGGVLCVVKIIISGNLENGGMV